MKHAFYNGQYILKDEAKTNIDDRGYQFGDGIYEVIRVYNGTLSLFEEHMIRFQRSCQEIDIELPYSIDELTSIAKELISLNKVDSGMIYMQVTRGIHSRAHNYPVEPLTPQLFAYTKPVVRPENDMQTGVGVMFADDIRWLRCDIKSLNLLGNVMAKQKAKNEGHFEAIFVREDYVTEGSASNFFIVKNGTIITHPANNLILNGIARTKIIELALKLGIPVEERKYTKEEVIHSDEAFLSSTINEVMPVVNVDNKTISSSPGPITLQLQHAFEVDQNIPHACNKKEKAI